MFVFSVFINRKGRYEDTTEPRKSRERRSKKGESKTENGVTETATKTQKYKRGKLLLKTENEN